MLLTYIYIDIVPDVPDTSGESKNNIGPPSSGPKIHQGPEDVLPLLLALASNCIVLPELVSEIHSAHVRVVLMDDWWHLHFPFGWVLGSAVNGEWWHVPICNCAHNTHFPLVMPLGGYHIALLFGGHGGCEVGTKSFGYISVKFIRLLLI